MIVLGSTGSIGVNALVIAKRYGITIDVLVAGRNIALLNEQIDAFRPRRVVVARKEDVHNVKHADVWHGEEAIVRAIEESESQMVLNSLVGFLGLRPTLKAIACGKKVALANKESLVVAGEFLNRTKIIPIDSEHFGLWYLLDNTKALDRLVITASGGAFRDWKLSKLQNATYSDALKHPNWKMGEKITIDSATMVNKLFEVLEAKWLFDCNRIEGFIEKNSLIHSLIEYKDGSTTLHLASTDMKLPIAFAMLGTVHEPILPKVDLTTMKPISFEPIDTARYPIWEIKDRLIHEHHLGVIVNRANEEAIALFKAGKIGFMDISKLILKSVQAFEAHKPLELEDIFKIDKEVKKFIQKDS